MAENLLVVQNITKTYPGVTALSGVTLEIRKGEAHALVGENGAGKSTLIKTCAGAVVPDSGKIIVNGKAFSAMTPRLSKENGIAVIYQEFNLVGELSVAENIFLGRAPLKGIRIDRGAMEKESEAIFKRFNININPGGLVKNLTVGYQQIVEIAKAVSQNANLLVMDEPSAPLTSQEVEGMFSIVDQLKAQGVTIIYISHRLEEIFRLCDRVTIMRDGRRIETLNTVDTSVDHLVTAMVGRELKETYPPRNSSITDEVILETKNLCGNGLRDISFKLRRGETLGLGGLIGAGRTELAELLFGAKPKTSGEILMNGKPVASKTPQQAIRLGIALVPEDRKRQGALLDIDIKGNISMVILGKISTLSVVNKAQEKTLAESYKNSLMIKTPNINQKIKNLSGGNQQKVIIAKWLAATPDIIIFDEPTRGIDVGAKYEIYKLINTLVESGKTLLLISSEMEELIGMSDRILVLSEGRIAGELEKKDFDQERIMAFASRTQATTNSTNAKVAMQ
ncbi:MAG: sugar ABC transporter ATP-binding protein [Treponema sp.]|jgi:ribose transport system ATP-binding protein|nr:sugar ABC transporter ATP-binding protein [Treponema sp.]